MKVTRYRRWTCGGCGMEMDSAASRDSPDDVPRQGDLSVCLGCAEPHMLDGETWLPLSDDQLISLSLEEKQVLSRMQIAVREFNRQRKP